MSAGRLSREYLAQIAGFATALADRILLAGLMVRFWGAESFGAWAAALAAGSMVALFDFGLSSYFSNRLLVTIQNGEVERSRRILRAGNRLLPLVCIFGVAMIGTGWALLHRPIGGIDSGTTLLWIVLAIATATATRQATAIQIALYRAHQQFARHTWLFTITDVLRIVALVIALLAGAGPLEAAFVYLAAMVFLSAIPSLIDLHRLYPDYPLGIGPLPHEERRPMFVVGGQYWLQSGATTLITYAPTLLLGLVGATGVAIAQFALMRTLANFSLAVLVLFANVFGLEVSRRLAVGDQAGAGNVYREATRLLAVQTAGATGALAALGSELFALWTGEAQLFDPLLFWLALGPPVVIPSMAMALQVMATANWPKPLMAGRIAQLMLTVALFLLLPVESVALRLMAALAIGEIVGLGLIVAIAVARRIPGAGLAMHLDILARSALALALAFGAAQLGSQLGGYTGLLVGGAAAGLVLAALIFALGLSQARRQQVLAGVQARLRHQSSP